MPFVCGNDVFNSSPAFWEAPLHTDAMTSITSRQVNYYPPQHLLPPPPTSPHPLAQTESGQVGHHLKRAETEA